MSEVIDVIFQHERLNDFICLESVLAQDRLLLHPRDVDSDESVRLVNYFIDGGAKYHCLLDRNIVSALVSLIRGAKVPLNDGDHPLRRVAALQAFLTAAHIESDPSIAYHEYIDSVGVVQADEELAVFRSADNLDPNIYLDIGLGLRDHVPKNAIERYASGELVSRELPSTLKHFARNLVVIKKALVLRHASASEYDAMLRLLDWLHTDYLFAAPAYHYLCLLFSRGRIRRMLKSQDVAGVENAAWDLCFLQHWIRQLSLAPDAIWLAATADKAIVKVAQLMFVKQHESDDDYFERLARQYRLLWSAKHGHGAKLLSQFRSFGDTMNDPARKIHSADSAYIQALDQAVEAEFARIVLNTG